MPDSVNSSVNNATECPGCGKPLVITEGYIQLCSKGQLPAIIKQCKQCELVVTRPKHPERLKGIK